MNITQITENKKHYLDLLLLADEQESMIDRYLDRGDMYVLEDNGVKATCVVTGENKDVCELKSIAVVPDAQRKGYGRMLLNDLITRYSKRYKRMIVGTGEVPSAIGFYTSCGFTYSHRIENFFTDNYSHPIIEDGIRLKDMICLKRNLENNITVRIALKRDITELRDLYRNTVLTINKRDYTQAEVEDWASCGDDLARLEEMIKTHFFIVAENPQSKITGFSSITPEGYLHSMFIHKDFQGMGIATILLENIEQYAKEHRIARITSEVSLTARSFFEKHGYKVDAEQKRKANQLSLVNFWMSKFLNRIKP